MTVATPVPQPATRKATRRPLWRRAVFPLLAAILVAAVAAFAAWQAGRGVVAPDIGPRSATLPATGPVGATVNGVGPGDSPWVNQYKLGRLVAQFTAARFDPQTDGSFRVTRPVAVLYLDRGKWLRVTGTDGIVNFDAPVGQKKTALGTGGVSAPSHGWLHTVRIDEFPTIDATRPTLTMVTDNIQFDNETLTLYTRGIPETGVTGDQVPVTVRGDEYEFDGRGLTVRWDGRTGKLLLLEIAHGHRLEVLNPSKVSLPGMTPAAPTTPTAPAEWRSPMLASADPAAASLGMPTDPTTPQPPTLYRATFADDVKVDRGTVRMAVADFLSIDFLQGPQPPAQATTAAVSRPAGPPGRDETAIVPDAPAAAKRALAGDPTTAPATGPAVPPAAVDKAKPDEPVKPITVYWTGLMRVAPLKESPAMPVGAGQSVVRLIGTPAVLTPSGPDVATVVKAAVATFRSGDDAVELASSAAWPRVWVHEARGVTLATPHLVYDPATSLATIAGPADLLAPAGKADVLHATWSDRAVLRVVGRGDHVTGVDRADLTGDVVANDPAFDLRAGHLLLDLLVVPKGAKDHEEQLRSLAADDAVRCKLPQVGRPDRGIDSDHLIVDMAPAVPDHQPQPRVVTADGRVHAYDGSQDLTSDHLDATLAAKPVVSRPAATKPAATKPTAGPATRPGDPADASAIEALTATGHVHASPKSGVTADADELTVRTVDGKQLVQLRRPTGATVADGRGKSLTGAVIDIDAATRRVVVGCPGVLRSVDPTGRRHPTDATWAGSLTYDPVANTADLRDAVTVHVMATAADGTDGTVVGDAAHLVFADAAAATTRPAGDAAAAAGPETGGKDLVWMRMTGHVHGDTTLYDAAGALVRRGRLKDCDALLYTAADGRVTVPGPGILFVENHPPTVKPVAVKPAAASPKGGSTAFGDLAIRWKTSLVYDRDTDRITFDGDTPNGDTTTGFRPDAKGGAADAKGPDVMQMLARRLVITLRRSTPPANGATRPAGERQDIESVVATGGVRFTGRGLAFDCHEMTYDPDARLMVAKGSAAEPGLTRGAEGNAIGGFDELDVDTDTQEVRSGRKVTGSIRK